MESPGSLFLTLFMKEGLHAKKWQIGLLMTVTFLGPIWEPAGTFLAERLGKRRPLFLATFLLSRMGFFFLAAIPLLALRGMAPQRGIVLVLLVVAITRFFNHLGNPSWWSWMADLVHERRRGRFFGCRIQASMPRGGRLRACRVNRHRILRRHEQWQASERALLLRGHLRRHRYLPLFSHPGTSLDAEAGVARLRIRS